MNSFQLIITYLKFSILFVFEYPFYIDCLFTIYAQPTSPTRIPPTHLWDLQLYWVILNKQRYLMISDEKQRTQWGCRSCVIVREVWRRGEGWGWEVVGFITYNTKGSQNWDCVTYLGCIYMDHIYRYRGNE